LRGHAHLVNASIDWGQDLFYLERWLRQHPEAAPIHMALYTFVPQEAFGEEFERRKQPGKALSDNAIGGHPWHRAVPLPGWYALSVHRIRSDSAAYADFLQLEPVATAGYSVYVYHVTLQDSNRLRRAIGLPELTGRAGEIP
jgi:hypothetical protein